MIQRFQGKEPTVKDHLQYDISGTLSQPFVLWASNLSILMCFPFPSEDFDHMPVSFASGGDELALWLSRERSTREAGGPCPLLACSPQIPISPGQASTAQQGTPWTEQVTSRAAVIWMIRFDLGIKLSIWIWCRSGHWSMRVTWARFITAYFTACGGIVCSRRTIKSLFYLIRKLLRQMKTLLFSNTFHSD